MSTRSLLALAACGAAVAALPAPAGAATLATDLPCYPERYPVSVAGNGWGPNTRWSVQTEQVFTAGTADALGAFTGTFEAPLIPENTVKPKTFTLTGSQDGAPVAEATFQVVNFLVKLDTDRGRPTGRTMWRFSGFAPGRTVYVHVRRGGKTLSNTKIATSSAPCGTGKRRLARLPGVRRPRNGTYKLYVDSSKKFSAKTRPQYRADFSVFTRFR